MNNVKKVPPDYYQKGVKNNFAQRTWHLNKLKAVLGLIGKRSPNTILDIGCASGWFLNQISNHFPKARCAGIDIDSKLIAYGKKLYPHLKLNTVDAHKLPFPAKSFDMIICTEVLEHITRPHQVLEEIRRVLKPDGFVILEIDTGNFLFKMIWYVWTHFTGKVWKGTHLHSLSEQELERMFERIGFRINKKKAFNLSMAIAFELTKV